MDCPGTIASSATGELCLNATRWASSSHLLQLAESSIYESLKLKASLFRSPSIYGCRDTTALCMWTPGRPIGDPVVENTTLTESYKWAIFAVKDDPVTDLITEGINALKDKSLLYCSTNSAIYCSLGSADEAQNVSILYLNPLGDTCYIIIDKLIFAYVSDMIVGTIDQAVTNSLEGKEANTTDQPLLCNCSTSTIIALAIVILIVTLITPIITAFCVVVIQVKSIFILRSLQHTLRGLQPTLSSLQPTSSKPRSFKRPSSVSPTE